MDEPTCAVDGCDKRSRNRGWCSGHYERWRLTGDVQADVPLRMPARPYPPGAKCAIEGCEDRPSSRNWCEKHYEQWRRFGDPLFARKVIGDDLETLEANVDRSTDPDACHLWTGRLSPDGYGWAKKDGSWTLAHIAAWEFENGVRPSGAELDHECHNRAVREGTCRPGKCAHRRCCNLSHIVLRTSKREHYDVTVPWDRSAWAYSNAKLTEAQVREIRELLADGKPASRRTDLAERYAVSTMTIYRIATGKAWGHLPDVA
jgi:hypothetical protein